ncbi:uncharacterized protein RDI95_011733 isoform 1-T2 [Morus bassanus]
MPRAEPCTRGPHRRAERSAVRRCCIAGEVISSPCCLGVTGGVQASTRQPELTTEAGQASCGGAARRLRGVTPHAEERSEKVRRLWARLLYYRATRLKRFSLVLQVLCGLLLELDECLSESLLIMSSVVQKHRIKFRNVNRTALLKRSLN